MQGRRSRSESAARDATTHTYRIDEFPPESAVGRGFGSSSFLPGSLRARASERVSESHTGNDKGRYGQPDKDGDKGAWERDRRPGSERKKMQKGKMKGGGTNEEPEKRTADGEDGAARALTLAREYRARETDGKHERARRGKSTEGNNREPLLRSGLEKGWNGKNERKLRTRIGGHANSKGMSARWSAGGGGHGDGEEKHRKKRRHGRKEQRQERAKEKR